MQHGGPATIRPDAAAGAAPPPVSARAAPHAQQAGGLQRSPSAGSSSSQDSTRCASEESSTSGVDALSSSSQPQQAMVDASGRSFEERFALSGTKLGDGMTACVFVCTDRVTGRLCACKLASRRGQRPAWSRLCQLLWHESLLLQEIGVHPNVVRWEGCFASNNRIAIVMELVGGGDCQQLLQRHGALPEESVQGMMRQLHSALRYVWCLPPTCAKRGLFFFCVGRPHDCAAVLCLASARALSLVRISPLAASL